MTIVVVMTKLLALTVQVQHYNPNPHCGPLTKLIVTTTQQAVVPVAISDAPLDVINNLWYV